MTANDQHVAPAQRSPTAGNFPFLALWVNSRRYCTLGRNFFFLSLASFNNQRSARKKSSDFCDSRDTRKVWINQYELYGNQFKSGYTCIDFGRVCGDFYEQFRPFLGDFIIFIEVSLCGLIFETSKCKFSIYFLGNFIFSLQCLHFMEKSKLYF